MDHEVQQDGILCNPMSAMIHPHPHPHPQTVQGGAPARHGLSISPTAGDINHGAAARGEAEGGHRRL